MSAESDERIECSSHDLLPFCFPLRVHSRSWMVSPGLLGSGPMRIMIDMLEAAEGSAAATDLLGGLLVKPGEEGPALAADLFAAFVTGDPATVSESVSDDGSGLRSQVRMEGDRLLS